MADSSGVSISGPETLRGAMILLVLGLGLTGYGAYDYVQQSDAIRSAVEVDATITDVAIEMESARAGNARVNYEPRVEFTYEYQAIVTNVDYLTAEEIFNDYNQRCNIENKIDELKEGFSFDQNTQINRKCNELYLLIKMIALYWLACTPP